jgi:hypothetical protein
VQFFNQAEDVFEVQRGLNNCFAHDLVPAPSVIEAAVRAARRVDDFATAVRIFNGVKVKVENKKQYQQYLDELKGVREELGEPSGLSPRCWADNYFRDNVRRRALPRLGAVSSFAVRRFRYFLRRSRSVIICSTLQPKGRRRVDCCLRRRDIVQCSSWLSSIHPVFQSVSPCEANTASWSCHDLRLARLCIANKSVEHPLPTRTQYCASPTVRKINRDSIPFGSTVYRGRGK